MDARRPDESDASTRDGASEITRLATRLIRRSADLALAPEEGFGGPIEATSDLEARLVDLVAGIHQQRRHGASTERATGMLLPALRYGSLPPDAPASEGDRWPEAPSGDRLVARDRTDWHL
jgi:hypothetical protein